MISPPSKVKGCLFLLIPIFFSINICFAEAPKLVLKEDFSPHFFSGSKVNIKVFLENISKSEEISGLDWVLSAGEAIVLKGRGKRIPAKISFTIPEVKRKTKLVLGLNANVAGTPTQKTINIYAYPAGQLMELKNIFLNNIVGVYDPLDNLTKAFENYNLDFKKIITSLEMKFFKGDLLIISEDAISKSRMDVCAIIGEKISEGITIILLKQNVPFEIDDFELSSQDSSFSIDSVRKLAKGHQIFSELCLEDLCFWQPDGIVSATSLKKHVKGNFTVLGDNIRKGTLIEELKFARGKLIVCQIPIVDRLRIEPVTNMLLVNLIRYGVFVKPPKFKNISISAKPEIIEIIKEIGIQSEIISASAEIILLIDIPKDGKYQSDDLFTHGIRQFTDPMNAYLEKGNTLVVTNLTEDALKYFEDIIPCKLELEEVKIAQEEITVNNSSSLMWGISKEDIEETIKELQKKEKPIEYLLSFNEDDHCEYLIRPSILAKFKKGKGTVIINQIPFIETENPAYLRTISQLFTNLGVKITLDE